MPDTALNIQDQLEKWVYSLCLEHIRTGAREILLVMDEEFTFIGCSNISNEKRQELSRVFAECGRWQGVSGVWRCSADTDFGADDEARFFILQGYGATPTFYLFYVIGEAMVLVAQTTTERLAHVR